MLPGVMILMPFSDSNVLHDAGLVERLFVIKPYYNYFTAFTVHLQHWLFMFIIGQNIVLSVGLKKVI
jgi:hypothetical protein